MNRIVISLSLLAATLHTAAQSHDSTKQEINDTRMRSYRETVNKAFPKFSFIEKEVTIDNKFYANKVLFLHFWSTGSPSSIAELDALNELYEEFSLDSNFAFLSLSYESPELLASMREKHNIKYRMLSISREECSRLTSGSELPTSILLDNKGILRYRLSGAPNEPERARAFIVQRVYPEIRKRL